MSNDSKVVSIVDAAKKPRKPKVGSGNGTGSGDNNIAPLGDYGNYIIKDGCFVQLKKTYYAVDPTKILISHFVAKILEQITFDDGQEDQNSFLIEITRKDGRVSPLLKVPFSKFFSKANWACEAFGVDLHIAVGATVPANLQAAIQLFSTNNGTIDVPKKQVFGYLGWKKIEDKWVYLTGSGAISAKGLKTDVLVDLGRGTSQFYRLSEPLDSAGIKQAAQHIRDLLLIAPAKPYIGAALLATVCRAPLNECLQVD